MKRRDVLISGTALLAGLGSSAIAFDSYKPGLIQSALDAGEVVFVDYGTDWCPTCARQERIVEELRANNAIYDQNITFIQVDFDVYATHEVSTSRNIPRRSTLLILQGDQELGRIVAGTAKSEIKALLDIGVKAAQG